MESFTGFVVSDVTLRKPKEKIIDQIAKELNSQLAIFEFQITQNRRTFAITFDKPQKLEQIQQLFPTNDCKSIPKYEQRVTKYQPIYITNFPLEFKEKEKFTKLIEIFGDAQSIIFSKGFSIVQMKKDYYSTCLARFLPEIQFETGKFDVYLNSDDIPLVHISPIPIKFTEGNTIPFPGVFLRVGIESEDVRVLQEYINYISQFYNEIPSLTPTGYFGSRTNEAVMALQRLFGTEPSGIVGPITWDNIAGLYSDLYNGSRLNEGQYPGYELGQ